MISNKEGARDPEGETVLRDLVHRTGFEYIKGVRAGKYLRVDVESTSPEAAEALVKKMCDDLRIYNPSAHSLVVRAGRLPA